MSTAVSGKAVWGRARVILGVMAAAVFATLVLVRCGGSDDDLSLDSQLTCANGEAWVTADEDIAAFFGEQGASKVGVILQGNGKARYIVCDDDYQSEGCCLGGEGSWSTNGNNITLTIDGDDLPGSPATYTVSGNTAVMTLENGVKVPVTKEKRIFAAEECVVYEASGGKGASAMTGTINVHVRDGGGYEAFRRSDSVYVTLLYTGTPQLFGDNGAVNFRNLTEGSYEIRVEKEGYATIYYSTKLDKYDPEIASNGLNLAGGVVNVAAVLYPLTAGLKGTVLFETPSDVKGPAANVTVRVEVEINEGPAVNPGDVKARVENRVFVTKTNGSGLYEFQGLPAVGKQYKIVALGGEFGGGAFGDIVVDNPPALVTGGTTTAQTFTFTDYYQF